ncbi:glycosyltransferase family 4 protein [Pantoea sp. BIGb0393]|uniref:Glycosyltransferase n=1 Tax=Pantoea nemavictus TaxID=2726955 RepID=A0ABU8PSA9_9GAMM|nr:glycosyltransferase [Pantoea nemavictus]MBA0035982.1 glycosyltransferase family 4 protein [Pantoea nemavictus]
MKIITSGEGYPEKRNILVNADYHYINGKKRNLYFYLNAIRQRLLKKNKIFRFQGIPGFMPADVEVIHLFNEVAISPIKWVATFETEIPRVLPVAGISKVDNPELHAQMKWVAAPACIGLIAISEATRNIQLKLLSSFPAYQDTIASKIRVLHPPQPLLASQPRAVSADKLQFTFVGNEFYRKGGAEVVLAFTELFEAGAIDQDSVQVTLIGDVSRRHNIAHRHFQDSAIFCSQIETSLQKLPIFQHKTCLTPDEVIAQLQQTDVGLLPTWQDTYGFSVLEMQACGCPVISTNIRALPEINPATAGWLIECPTNEMYEYSVDSLQAKDAIRKALVEQLKVHIMDAVENRQAISLRSAQAMERIRIQHDPLIFQQRLSEIYASVPLETSHLIPMAG